MLKTCKSLSLSAAWRDRRPKDMHPKLLAAVRLHLAVLHAAIDEQDLKQAFADRLSPLYDPSVPFPAKAPAESRAEALEDAGTDHRDNRLPCGWRVELGYGWRLEFVFKDGQAWGVSLESGEPLR